MSNGNTSKDEYGLRRRNKKANIYNAIKTAKMLNINKPVYFNVMLCGKSQSGKTKFLKRFLAEVEILL